MLDLRKEMAAVTDSYNTDAKQTRFSFLIPGDVGSGKSALLRTCRFPVLVHSFDKAV